ncbi:hypothetical protein K445DRAFT_320160 [Daldinia sp. EC12]|nr:hypothetical protein K445DRAFT_320160 [Daldinia sp. EC12]
MRDSHRAGRSPELRHIESLFDEKKWSLCLQIVRTSGPCAYTLIILYDGFQWGSDDLKGNGLVPCGKAVGIFHFQAMLCTILDVWYDNWTEVLDSISQVVGIELNNTQNEKCWDEFMFDTSSRLSRLYFAVIQLFRLITEWIEESASEINQLKRKFREIRYEVRLGLSANEIASVEKNWDTISSKMNLLGERLYSRIHRKPEEIKSLRDGLLNATSLRDADRAMALNRAVYVFTAVTIIYTPLGFMATFWALPVLNSSSNNESAISWKAFISTFVLIPALTYIICPIAVWYFSLESSQRSSYSENIHKIQLDLRKRIRDKATVFSHKIKVSTFRRHILRPATGSDAPAEGIELENSRRQENSHDDA